LHATDKDRPSELGRVTLAMDTSAVVFTGDVVYTMSRLLRVHSWIGAKRWVGNGSAVAYPP